jgi:hypothetical protein
MTTLKGEIPGEDDFITPAFVGLALEMVRGRIDN